MSAALDAGRAATPASADHEPPALFGPRPASVDRLRLATICLALVLLTVAQDAGSTAADTKIDLVADPLRFLAKSLTLWDPTGSGGQLQNQAYGYLFPVGPFFLACHGLGLQPWLSQRLWASTLVVAAFLGTRRLARLLGIGGFWPPVVAGLVYALAPQMLAELFSISAGLTPTVALPWVLAPLVRGAERGSPRRAAAWSGVALLFAGGTNAAATLAILPAPALWLLTRRRGPRRAALLRNWLLAVLLSSAWWAIPLVLFGRYSPPFLNWIEAAQNTTASTSLSANLRGVEHWESYLGPGIWPAGWILVRASAAIVATTMVAAAGLAGLAQRRQPHRLFLLSCLGTGLAILSVGHLASVTGPFAGQLQAALDGVLVAFRNIHKFDPLVRLPIAIGVGLLLSRSQAPWWKSLRGIGLPVRLPSRLLQAGLIAAVALIAVTPALGNRLVPQPRADVVPSWWQQAGRWLNANSHDARTLVVPGASTPTYFWGSTMDDALQPETDAPWIVRSSIPLAPAGTIRLLDEITSRLDAGHRDDELSALLARSGIGFVLLRNDLDTVASLSTPYNIVRATLLNSPGFSRAATFGPQLDGGRSGNDLVDGGAGVSRPAIEIYQVGKAQPPVALLPVSAAVLANGASDNLGQLVDRGLPESSPVLFGPDAAPLGPVAGAVRVTTDGIRRQQADFGSTPVKSATMSATAPYRGRRAAYDYLPDPAPALSTMSYTGIRDVSASSSGADVYAPFNRSPANGPFAAIDGDPNTAWRSASFTGAVRQWLQVDFARPVSPVLFSANFLPVDGAYPSRITVHTAGGTRALAVEPSTATQTFSLPPGQTTSLRITVQSMSDGSFGSGVAISSLTVPGIQPERSLTVPAPAGDLLAFDAAPGYRDGCLDVDGAPSCDSEFAAAGEEDRVLARRIQLDAPRSYQASASVRLLATSSLDAELDQGSGIQATATSVVSDDPRLRPGAAVDDDPNTTWSAAAGDPRPTLTLRFRSPRTVRGLLLQTSATAPVAAPRRVLIQAGNLSWEGALDSSGQVRLSRPVRTDTVTVTVEEAAVRSSISTLTGHSRLLPTGISTLVLDDGGLPGNRPPAGPPATVHLGCDEGLTLTVDGRPIPMTLTAPTAQVLLGQPVTAQACSPAPIALGAGQHELRLTGPAGVLPRALTMSTGRGLDQQPATSGTASIARWSAASRRVSVATTAASLLTMRENFNAGWTARLGNTKLRAVQVDGWQQAFLVPADRRGTVVLSYRPQRAFGAGLLLGLLAVLGLLALAVAPARRTEPPASPAGRLPYLAQIALLLALGLQTAGATGLLTALVLVAVCRLLWPPGRAMPAWVGALTFVAAGVEIASATAIDRFTVANSSLTQLLTLSAVVLTAAAGLPDWRRRRRES
jgi:arabinofuranan 3-O-arabinosyltransferase